MGRNPQRRPGKSSRKKEICKEKIDRIVNLRTFEPYSRPAAGCRFLRFTERGQKVSGRLGYPIKNFRQGTSYPLQLANGEVVELIGNRLIHEQIRKGELCGRQIEIVYQGKDYTYGGHHRKILRIYRIEDRPIFTKKQWNEILKRTREIKNGKQRKKDSLLPELSAAGN